MVSLVTDKGVENLIAAWAAYADAPVYLQFGTGSGQGSADNDLDVPSQTRELGVASQETENVAGDTLQVTGAITGLSDLTVTEVGLFDAATDGNMAIYGDFTGIDLAAGDAIVFSVSITASSA